MQHSTPSSRVYDAEWAVLECPFQRTDETGSKASCNRTCCMLHVVPCCTLFHVACCSCCMLLHVAHCVAFELQN